MKKIILAALFVSFGSMALAANKAPCAQQYSGGLHSKTKADVTKSVGAPTGSNSNTAAGEV